MKRGLSHGLALVELLVSMAVGLVVTLFSATLMVMSNASYLTQDDIAAVEDAGRFALDAIGRSVRQAAYRNWGELVDSAETEPAHVAGFDDRTLSGTTPALEKPRGDAVNGSDVLALRYSGAADGGVLNCAGFAVLDSTRGWSIFYVAKGSDGVGELRCKYRGTNAWKAEAIVRGVDTMQVLYGIDTDTPADGLPNTYETATQIDARDGALALSGASAQARARDLNRKTHWKRVCGVRVSLLLHGLRPAQRGAFQPPFHMFGHAYTANGDAGTVIDPAGLAERVRYRERRVFGATFLLRNNAS